ncbi:MAG: site-specific DNA-methyltransferase [Bacteroidaceae bacterium]|nr:site-specific DNA-methyltransferase [Bacteroidaceae bacterium]
MIKTEDFSVDLVVTSPPYPMIEMWDEIMAKQNPDIAKYMDKEPEKAFELMHKELDKVWSECFRVLKPGGFLCINIGDATRTINGNFTLYNNHSRISNACIDLGFIGLPNIIWRKQTNAPNKFMGSGMLPCGAYVTLEHEWILVFRKGDKRVYKTADAKLDRMKSSFFWEERNVWFSDLWEIKGIKQNLRKSNTRERSAAFPFEVPFRLINMFSQKGDMVLDPFLGTGTTMQAAILTGRNSCGYDIDANFEDVIREGIETLDVDLCNGTIKKRFDTHKEFVENRENSGKVVKHFNNMLDCKVMTKQETEIELNYLTSIVRDEKGTYVVGYEDYSDLTTMPLRETLFAVAQ